MDLSGLQNINLLWIVLPSAVILFAAYFTYGRLLVRLFELNPKVVTPAEELNDGLDYEPLPASSLFPQHFSAIAAAGPIVGPILAGMMFGWLPALIWILIGSILIGGVHDFSSLVASIRHRACSIAEVVRDNMSRTSYLLFLSFIWIALVYIIVAFTDITALSFVGLATADAGNVSGGAIAMSSLLYLILPIVMGLLMRYAGLSLNWATAIFIPLVGLAIYVGPFMPLEANKLFWNSSTTWEVAAAEVPTKQKELNSLLAQQKAAALQDAEDGKAFEPAIAALQAEVNPVKLAQAKSQKLWNTLLLCYCLVAGVVPVWMLLQPRGHLGGYFLYFALGAGALGLVFGGATIQYPAFRGWSVPGPGGVPSTLFPMVFIMIACGACSGFHSLIASGTTSKQLKSESDAKPVGYGAMLLEAMVAIVSLCCVMMFAEDSPQLLKGTAPNTIYAHGIGRFMGVISSNPGFQTFAISFALMAFTTFVYDTLDVCTRLGRYILCELTGWHSMGGKIFGTALTAGVPLFFLLRHPLDAAEPVWRIFWNLFGASNQLLAALTLLGVTVWLWRTRRAWWVWVVTGIPTIFMYVMSLWALGQMTLSAFFKDGKWNFLTPDPVPYIGLVLMALAVIMAGEGVRIVLSLGMAPPSPPSTKPALA